MKNWRSGFDLAVPKPALSLQTERAVLFQITLQLALSIFGVSEETGAAGTDGTRKHLLPDEQVQPTRQGILMASVSFPAQPLICTLMKTVL